MAKYLLGKKNPKIFLQNISDISQIRKILKNYVCWICEIYYKFVVRTPNVDP